MPTRYLLILATCQAMENYFSTACSLAVRMLRGLYLSALYCLDSFQILLHFAQVLMSQFQICSQSSLTLGSHAIMLPEIQAYPLQAENVKATNNYVHML